MQSSGSTAPLNLVLVSRIMALYKYTYLLTYLLCSAVWWEGWICETNLRFNSGLKERGSVLNENGEKLTIEQVKIRRMTGMMNRKVDMLSW